MKRLITTFASAILLLTSTACVTQPTCNVEEMIAMKDKGFDQNRIEAMCMSRRLDIGGMAQVVSSGVRHSQRSNRPSGRLKPRRRRRKMILRTEGCGRLHLTVVW